MAEKKEYIRRDEAVRVIEEIIAILDDSSNECGREEGQILDFVEAKHSIKAIPAADVVEVAHGEWLPPAIGEYGCLCNLCLSQADNDFAFCPNCGAKMTNGW